MTAREAVAAPARRRGPLTALGLRPERRTVILTLVLTTLILGLGLLGLCYGASWKSPGEVFAALSGAEPSVVIQDWRLPRVLAALVFGAALGVSGALFQNLTRNPMGSPDVIGLDAGAYTGALVALTVLSGASVQLAVGSVLGGLVVAAVIYLLAYDRGFSGLRLVVIGVAVNAMVTAAAAMGTPANLDTLAGRAAPRPTPPCAPARHPARAAHRSDCRTASCRRSTPRRTSR